MATYAIGDIQGCYHAFLALLNELKFNPKKDQLRLVGDLINRGNGSLKYYAGVISISLQLK